MSKVTDEQLRGFIETVFNQFDQDRSGHLNVSELANFFNQVYTMMGQNVRLNQAQAQ